MRVALCTVLIACFVTLAAWFGWLAVQEGEPALWLSVAALLFGVVQTVRGVVP